MNTMYFLTSKPTTNNNNNNNNADANTMMGSCLSFLFKLTVLIVMLLTGCNVNSPLLGVAVVKIKVTGQLLLFWGAFIPSF